MKTTTFFCLFLLTNCLASFAQEHGKIGLRIGGGFSTLYGNLSKSTPIPSYSVALFLAEKNKPFSIRYELAFESKGGYTIAPEEKQAFGIYLFVCCPNLSSNHCTNMQ